MLIQFGARFLNDTVIIDSDIGEVVYPLTYNLTLTTQATASDGGDLMCILEWHMDRFIYGIYERVATQGIRHRFSWLSFGY